MQDFRNSRVWKKAHALTLYRVTNCLPKDETFGLRSQMRRSAALIGTNIAEGCGRVGDPELSRFLLIAMGSPSELEYQLLLCRDLDYLEEDQFTALTKDAIDVKRMLASLIQSLSPRRPNRPRKPGTDRLTD